jgi:hypothetical protein
MAAWQRGSSLRDADLEGGQQEFHPDSLLIEDINLTEWFLLLDAKTALKTR